NVFCQYDVNSFYYINSSTFYPWNIDTRLCTHVVFGSIMGIDEDTGALGIKDTNLLDETDRLKSQSVQKVMISVGGTEEECRILSKVFSSEYKRENFINTLVSFMLKMGYEGAQIDWRYPQKRSDDMTNFILFLEELGVIFRNHDFILMVMALGRTDKQNLDGYNITEIVNNVDFINLMVDDERDKNRQRLTYMAPLYGGTNSVSAAVKHWMTVGKAPHKLILNIPFFGRSYIMANNQSAVGSPCKGLGLPARLSNIAGFITFKEYCTQISKWSRHFDKEAKVPYATRKDHWLTYENSKSIWAKMHFLKKNELGGAMAWTIDADDHLGACGIPFPLLTDIYSALGDPDMLTTTERPTSEAMGICPRDGFFVDKWECRYYYECRGGVRTDYECLVDEFFDEATGYCRPAHEVKCNQDYVIWKPGMPVYNYDNIPLNLKVVE
ncbi:hypothetical protein KR032_009801, partial [Drosophila birchii]